MDTSTGILNLRVSHFNLEEEGRVDMTDILLHQSGHIMLSDFDLSKQSGEPGGAPATIKSGGPNGVCPLIL